MSVNKLVRGTISGHKARLQVGKNTVVSRTTKCIFVDEFVSRTVPTVCKIELGL